MMIGPNKKAYLVYGGILLTPVYLYTQSSTFAPSPMQPTNLERTKAQQQVININYLTTVQFMAREN